jgi:hypothetical protein
MLSASYLELVLLRKLLVLKNHFFFIESIGKEVNMHIYYVSFNGLTHRQKIEVV